MEDARQVVENFVSYYNGVRLHSALGYIAPKDKLEGRAKEIFSARDRKLADARELRKASRRAAKGLIKEQSGHRLPATA